MPEVRLVNVSKRFGRVVAVDRVNLHVNDGEYLTLLGPSGCGKTTLLRIISGLLHPDEGEIYIGGKLMNDIPPEERDIGFVFQLFAVFPHMTVWENVAYGPLIRGEKLNEVEGKVNEILKRLKISDRAADYPRELSSGEMQRVGVARALATGAKLLLLDEPLGALDVKIRFELRSDLRHVVKSLGLTAIHVTHDQEEAMSISDRIAVMRKGHILQVDTPRDLYEKPENVFIANFIGEISFLEGVVLKVHEGGSLIELREGLRIWVYNKVVQKGEKVVAAIRPEKVKVRRGEIDEINALQGYIKRSKFVGWFNRFEVNLDNGDSIIVEEPATDEHFLNPGDRVTVIFDPEDILLYPYPGEGLERALSLE